ncbi:hypothetical protein [Amycolatopsis sp. NPDC004625]|uniref:hypothetical protein n=1 Tax=Amycolatopsis sp. NPDC004625 TaxID=3154670 RepID=UPI0033A61C8A
MVGVHGSDISSSAIDFADRHDRELPAVHSWTDLPMHGMEPVGGWADDPQDISRRGQEVLAGSLAGHAEHRRPAAQPTSLATGTAPAGRCGSPAPTSY